MNLIFRPRVIATVVAAVLLGTCATSFHGQSLEPQQQPVSAAPAPKLQDGWAWSLTPDRQPVRRPAGVHYRKAGDVSQGGLQANSVAPTCASPHLSYLNGPVISHVQVIPVFWGTHVNAEVTANIGAYYQDLLSSPYTTALTEWSTNYTGGTNQSIGPGTLGSTGITISPSLCAGTTGCTVTDPQVQSELKAQIGAGTLPGIQYDSQGHATTLYMVHFPPNVTITGAGVGTSCFDYCAYHDTGGTAANPLLYAILPDHYTTGCSTGCGTNSTTGGHTAAFNNLSASASHEFAEAVTDAEVGLTTSIAAPLAWYDDNNYCGEVADICDTGGAGDPFTGAHGTWVTQEVWSNKLNSCVSSGVFPTLAVNPSTATPSKDQSFSFTVTATNPTSGQGTDTAYVNTVNFTSSDPQATLPSSYTFAAGDQGVHTFNATMESSGAQTITASDAFTSSAMNLTVSGTVNVTVGTNASGLSFTVDSTPYTTSQNFIWNIGDQHTIATTSPQSLGSTTYVFSNWSDSGALSHQVTASGGTTRYSAIFTPTAPVITVTASPSASVVYATPASVLVSVGGASGPATGTITFTINGGASQGPIPLSSGSALIGLGTLDAGVYSVAVRYSGDSNYTAGDPTTGSVTVNPAVLSVIAPSASTVAGAALPSLSPSYTGFVNGDSAAALSSGASCLTTATSGSATGTYPITCSGAAAIDYTFVYTPGTLTITKGTAEKITLAALPDVTYGVAPIALNGTASSGLPITYVVLQGNAVLTPAGNGFALTITGAGAVTVEARQSGNTTYAPAQPVDRTFNVAPHALSVIAANLKRSAGQGNPPLTYSFQGFVNGDTAVVLSGAPVLSTTALANSPEGTYDITIATGTLASTSYEFELKPGILTVTSAKTGTAQKITFANIANKTYGATAVTLAATASSGLPVSYSILFGPAMVAGNVLSFTGAGTVVVEADQGGNTTWEAADPVQRTFVVSPKILKVTADSAHRPYAQPNPVFSYVMTGFVNGETAAILSGAPSLSTTATSLSDAGTYTVAITTGTLSSANYTFDLEPGTLTITMVSQTLNFPALGTTPYGSGPIVLAATASSGLTVTYQIVGTSSAATLSGSDIDINGVGTITIEADQAGNIDYQPVSAKRTLTIVGAPLVVSADNKNKQQGDPNPTLTWSASGFVNGDLPSILTGNPGLTTTAKTGSPAGSYPIRISAGTLVVPPNYILQLLNGTLTVSSNLSF